MNRRACIGLFSLAMVFASGCTTSDAARHAAYEAAYQKGCIDRTGTPHCDPEHESYDDYRKQREKLVTPDHQSRPPRRC